MIYIISFILVVVCIIVYSTIRYNTNSKIRHKLMVDLACQKGLNPEQQSHNAYVDYQIGESEREHQEYIRECDEKRRRFKADNPDFPDEFLKTMFLPVKAKRQIIAIYYI